VRAAYALVRERICVIEAGAIGLVLYFLSGNVVRFVY
jgi:hypothetical protein